MKSYREMITSLCKIGKSFSQGFRSQARGNKLSTTRRRETIDSTGANFSAGLATTTLSRVSTKVVTRPSAHSLQLARDTVVSNIHRCRSSGSAARCHEHRFARLQRAPRSARLFHCFRQRGPPVFEPGKDTCRFSDNPRGQSLTLRAERASASVCATFAARRTLRAMMTTAIKISSLVLPRVFLHRRRCTSIERKREREHKNRVPLIS